MIDKNQAFLLELVKSALFKTPLEIPRDIDWDAVFEESVNQTVVSLIGGVVPAEHSAKFKTAQAQCRAQYMKILFEQNNLIKLLSDNQIPVIIIKGIGAAQYYPVPSNRVMGDIDVLVTAEDYEKSKNLLLENEYTLDHEDENRHAAYFKNGICVELHHRFSNDCPELENYLSESFSDIQTLELNGFKYPVLPDSVNGLLIIAHIQHHILADGLGLRHLTDWEMFVHAFPQKEFWTNTFLPMATVCGLTDFVTVITRLCQKYLALPDDVSWCDEVDDERLDFVMDYIFQSGNFGYKTDREETDVEKVSLRMKKAVKNKSLFRMLQENGQINWKASQRHPFLKPFAFIYQGFRYLFRGTKAVIHGDASQGLDKANKRYEIYKAFELDKKD